MSKDQVNDNFKCCLHETPRTLEWCETNCDKYYSCDTVADAIDNIKDIGRADTDE